MPFRRRAAIVAGRLCPPPSRPGTRAATPLSFRRTSAAAVGLRASLPPKMTSSMRSPRRLLALCSPSTQVSASTTLLLPQPFGPTIAVTPSSNVSSDRSGKLLKPVISSSVQTHDVGCRQPVKKPPADERTPRPGSGWDRFEKLLLEERLT